MLLKNIVYYQLMTKRFIVLGVKCQVQLGFHKMQCDADKKSRRSINKYWKKYQVLTKHMLMTQNTPYYTRLLNYLAKKTLQVSKKRD